MMILGEKTFILDLSNIIATLGNCGIKIDKWSYELLHSILIDTYGNNSDAYIAEVAKDFSDLDYIPNITQEHKNAIFAVWWYLYDHIGKVNNRLIYQRSYNNLVHFKIR